jgi:predicted metalloenzyme YecM
MELEFMLFALPLNVDIEKVLEDLQMEFIYMQCDTNLIKKFSKFLLTHTGREISSTLVSWIKT